MDIFSHNVINTISNKQQTTGHAMLINLHLNNIYISKGLNSANE